MGYSLSSPISKKLQPPPYLIWSEDVSGIAPYTLSECLTRIDTLKTQGVGLVHPFEVVIIPETDTRVTVNVRMFQYRSGWLIGTLETISPNKTEVSVRAGIDPGILLWIGGILITGLCILAYAMLTAAPGIFGVGLMVAGIPLTELMHGISGTKRELKVIFKETLDLT
ncbi:MAG: hypothetical protein ACPG7F_06525 [Aggregatilineales bacterium]